MLERRRVVDMSPAAVLGRRLPGLSAEELDDWLAVEPRAWVVEHGPTLRAAGLSAKDAADLHRRLGVDGASHLSSLVNAGRLADIDIAWIHLWAASGVLRAEFSGRAGRNVSYTAWVRQARLFIAACSGDQRLAAHAAGAGLSLEEMVRLRDAGELELDSLAMLAAFNDGKGQRS